MENPGEKHSEAGKHAITSYENKETARESCGKKEIQGRRKWNGKHLPEREAFTGTGNEFACLKVW